MFFNVARWLFFDVIPIHMPNQINATKLASEVTDAAMAVEMITANCCPVPVAVVAVKKVFVPVVVPLVPLEVWYVYVVVPVADTLVPLEVVTTVLLAHLERPDREAYSVIQVEE